MPRPTRHLLNLLGALALAAGTTACDSEAAQCTGPEILPHESPKILGSFFPLADGEVKDPGSPTKVPYEWTLFLRSTCSVPLVISKVCIVGDAHNGDEDDPAFTLEGPVPSTVNKGEAAAVRLTYDNRHVNGDADGDGKRDPDNIAVVVQSNAKNFPTLVIPVCAMIIPDDQEPVAFACQSPVVVPAGESQPNLCP